METESLLLNAIHGLQDPIPQYVLGSLPAILTIGATPFKGVGRKLGWFVRCLGCPFVGLFYFCNIKSDKVTMCAYWLSANNFIVENPNFQSSQIRYRPVGHHAKQINPPQNLHDPNDQQLIMIDTLKDCVAEASLLDRFASLVSLYYIVVGIFIGIAKAIQCMKDNSVQQDWPYIPLLFIWTIPITWFRAWRGLVVVKEPNITDQLSVRDYSPNNLNNLHNKQFCVAYIFLFSLLSPWFTVLIAYYTRPVGFFCRSKFLTIICSVWSFNNIMAYSSHIMKCESQVTGPSLLNLIFSICGSLLLGGLGFLSILASFTDLWVNIFGPSCYVPSSC
ncbi:4339_t:CDS:1 [Scutellospora calospora]|uniref:4339_t:CDS:1 n=1 Tax=Scutellospora calospora TaxID=85575 RepID=A0ACA9LBI7_9GLOM|nr:4339_t:CDS:1 [Scutellospora calospora]